MKKVIIAIIVAAIAIGAGLGVYFGFFAEDKNDSEIQITTVKDELVENIRLLEAFIRNPDRYKKVLAEKYELGEEKAAEFYESPEEWLTFEQLITISNTGSENVTVYGFEVENNGKDGVYISTDIGGELGIQPGGEGPASFSVLCSNIELSTDEVQAILDKMDISVVFSKTPAEFDDGSESVEETHISAIEKTAE